METLGLGLILRSGSKCSINATTLQGLYWSIDHVWNSHSSSISKVYGFKVLNVWTSLLCCWRSAVHSSCLKFYKLLINVVSFSLEESLRWFLASWIHALRTFVTKKIRQKYSSKEKGSKNAGSGYTFATLYDTTNRIPVFSAYKYTGRGNFRRPMIPWMVEPQVMIFIPCFLWFREHAMYHICCARVLLSACDEFTHMVQ